MFKYTTNENLKEIIGGNSIILYVLFGSSESIDYISNSIIIIILVYSNKLFLTKQTEYPRNHCNSNIFHISFLYTYLVLLIFQFQSINRYYLYYSMFYPLEPPSILLLDADE